MGGYGGGIYGTTFRVPPDAKFYLGVGVKGGSYETNVYLGGGGSIQGQVFLKCFVTPTEEFAGQLSEFL